MSSIDHGGESRTPRIGYLVVGLVFLGIAGSWALRAAGVVDASAMQWLVPAVLVAAGVVGLGAFTARGRDRAQQPPTLPDDHDDDPYQFIDTDQTTRIEGEQR